MDFQIVLDVSSVIWDEADFNDNKHHYYKLLDGLSRLLFRFEKENPQFLLRQELLDKMISHFPFKDISNEFWAIGEQVYSFLGKAKIMKTYPTVAIPDIESIPDLIKPHYNVDTQSEIKLLLSKMHSDEELQSVYFTFEYFWGDYDRLMTSVSEDSKEYETIISDKKNKNEIYEFDAFFEKFKLIFEHHSKHNKSPKRSKEAWLKADDKKGFVSQLTCYDGNNDKPQVILDSAIKLGEKYYGYDEENQVWVVFQRTHNDKNIWHGYDEYNENDHKKIPPEIKKHFNK